LPKGTSVVNHLLANHNAVKEMRSEKSVRKQGYFTIWMKGKFSTPSTAAP